MESLGKLIRVAKHYSFSTKEEGEHREEDYTHKSCAHKKYVSHQLRPSLQKKIDVHVSIIPRGLGHREGYDHGASEGNQFIGPQYTGTEGPKNHIGCSQQHYEHKGNFGHGVHPSAEPPTEPNKDVHGTSSSVSISRSHTYLLMKSIVRSGSRIVKLKIIYFMKL
jgi:hypothetical protein